MLCASCIVAAGSFTVVSYMPAVVHTAWRGPRWGPPASVGRGALPNSLLAGRSPGAPSISPCSCVHHRAHPGDILSHLHYRPFGANFSTIDAECWLLVVRPDNADSESTRDAGPADHRSSVVCRRSVVVGRRRESGRCHIRQCSHMFKISGR